MATVQAPGTEAVVEAIVNYFGKDTERILEFYQAVDPKLRGIDPLFDALIDGVDNWLIKTRWIDKFNHEAHGVREVIDEQGNPHTINLDEIEWE